MQQPRISDLCKHMWLHWFTCVQSPTHWSCARHIARLLTEFIFRKKKKNPRNFGCAYEKMHTNFNQFYLFQFSMQKLRISQIVQGHLAPRHRLRSITLPLELRASYCAVASRKHSSAVGSLSFTQAISVALTLKTNAHQFRLNCSIDK